MHLSIVNLGSGAMAMTINCDVQQICISKSSCFTLAWIFNV